MHLLALLHHRALALPGNAFDTNDVPDVHVPEGEEERATRRFGVLPFRYYWVEMAPDVVGEGDRGAGDLPGDLAEISSDLLEGLLHFDQGQIVEAVWNWRFNFEIHWGQHAVEALWALHHWMIEDDKRWSGPAAPSAP